jgi:hypothetical protein
MTVTSPYSRQKRHNQQYLARHQPGGLALSHNPAVGSKKQQRRPAVNITKILTTGLSDLYSSIQQQVNYVTEICVNI